MKGVTGKHIAVIAAVVLALVFYVWAMRQPSEGVNPTLQMDFVSATSRGFVGGYGTYVVYSRGQEVTEGIAIEFPLETADGATVYAMYYVFGRIEDYRVVTYAFRFDGEQRWLLTTYVPVMLRATIEEETRHVSLAAFSDEHDASEQLIKRRVLGKMAPVWETVGFSPSVVSILVYLPRG